MRRTGCRGCRGLYSGLPTQRCCPTDCRITSRRRFFGGKWSPPFDLPRLPFPATQALPSVKNLPPGDAYLEWIFVGTDHAAKVLHIAVFGHGCSSLTGIRTEETIDKVTIGVITHDDVPNRDTCNGAGRVAAVSVQVTAPLGKRGLWAFRTVEAK